MGAAGFMIIFLREIINGCRGYASLRVFRKIKVKSVFIEEVQRFIQL